MAVLRPIAIVGSGPSMEHDLKQRGYRVVAVGGATQKLKPNEFDVAYLHDDKSWTYIRTFESRHKLLVTERFLKRWGPRLKGRQYEVHHAPGYIHGAAPLAGYWAAVFYGAQEVHLSGCDCSGVEYCGQIPGWERFQREFPEIEVTCAEHVTSANPFATVI